MRSNKKKNNKTIETRSDHHQTMTVMSKKMVVVAKRWMIRCHPLIRKQLYDSSTQWKI